METTKLSLTPKQMEKLATGGAIMVGKEMMGGAIECPLHPSKLAKMRANHAAGKKYRLTMEPSEMHGGSWKQFKKYINTGFRAYKKHVVPVIGKPLRKGLKYGAHAGLETLAAMSGRPEAVAIARSIADELEKLVDLVGDKTGAYGMRR